LRAVQVILTCGINRIIPISNPQDINCIYQMDLEIHVHRSLPTETAGLIWHPEICPIAYNRKKCGYLFAHECLSKYNVINVSCELIVNSRKYNWLKLCTYLNANSTSIYLSHVFSPLSWNSIQYSSLDCLDCAMHCLRYWMSNHFCLHANNLLAPSWLPLFQMLMQFVLLKAIDSPMTSSYRIWNLWNYIGCFHLWGLRTKIRISIRETYEKYFWYISDALEKMK